MLLRFIAFPFVVVALKVLFALVGLSSAQTVQSLQDKLREHADRIGKEEMEEVDVVVSGQFSRYEKVTATSEATLQKMSCTEKI